MRKNGTLRATMTLLPLLTLHASAVAQQPVDANWTERGIASWYGPGFAGNPTASGEIYDPSLMTAAHKTLPLGTLVRVYNVDNDREMIVRINDRGPFIRGRIIDLSRAGAEVLGFRDAGLAQVELSIVQPPRTRSAGKAFVDAVERAVDTSLDAMLPSDTQSSSDEMGMSASDPDAAEAGEATTIRAASSSSFHEEQTIHGDAEGFFIQVGAFRDSHNAEDLIQRIENIGMSPQLRQTGNVVRVLVGPFAERNNALSAQRDLERYGIDGFVRTSSR